MQPVAAGWGLLMNEESLSFCGFVPFTDYWIQGLDCQGINWMADGALNASARNDERTNAPRD